MKLGILILWPVKVVFVLVVRREFWLAAAAGDEWKDPVHGCLVAGQAWAACIPVYQWLSPISYYNDLLGSHLSLLPFRKTLLKITAETKKLWKSWGCFYFFSFQVYVLPGYMYLPHSKLQIPPKGCLPRDNLVTTEAETKPHMSYWFLAADRLSSSGVVFRVDEDLGSRFQGTKSFSAQSNPCLELATD